MPNFPIASFFNAPQRSCRHTRFWPFAALVSLLSALLVPASFGQTVFLDFNTVGQYTNNFNPWNDTGGLNGGNYSYAENTAGGVGGSGGVAVFQSSDMTATYKSGSWDFSTNGSTIILSTM